MNKLHTPAMIQRWQAAASYIEHGDARKCAIACNAAERAMQEARRLHAWHQTPSAGDARRALACRYILAGALLWYANHGLCTPDTHAWFERVDSWLAGMVDAYRAGNRT